MRRKVPVAVVGDRGLLWDADDAIWLRREHRANPTPIGTLPRLPLQNEYRSLPLMLIPEEVTYLLEKQIILVVEDAKHHADVDIIRTSASPSSSSVKAVPTATEFKLADEHAINQNTDFVAETTEEALSKGIWSWPRTQDEIRRYRIYAHVRDAGFYCTAGARFGADYLLYKDDPFLVHADYSASALEMDTPIQPQDLVTSVRLATSVNKSYCVCAWDNDTSDVAAFSLEWAGF